MDGHFVLSGSVPRMPSCHWHHLSGLLMASCPFSCHRMAAVQRTRQCEPSRSHRDDGLRRRTKPQALAHELEVVPVPVHRPRCRPRLTARGESSPTARRGDLGFSPERLPGSLASTKRLRWQLCTVCSNRAEGLPTDRSQSRRRGRPVTTTTRAAAGSSSAKRTNTGASSSPTSWS